MGISTVDYPWDVTSPVQSWSAISLLAAGESAASPRRAVTDEELASRGLPPLAYVDNSFARGGDAPAVLAIRRGEAGYHCVETSRTAEEMNRAAGVSEAEVLAMVTGSMFGWDVPGAHPWTWHQHLRQVPRDRPITHSTSVARATAPTPPETKELIP